MYINVSNFHIVLIFNEYYTQIIAVFDKTDAEQKQTCCKPTITTIFQLSICKSNNDVKMLNERKILV